MVASVGVLAFYVDVQGWLVRFGGKEELVALHDTIIFVLKPQGWT